MQWKLFANLAEVAGERTVTVAVDGDDPTVGDALDALLEAHPELAADVIADGKIRDHINLLKNGVAVTEGVETPVDPDDELALFPPVSGG